MTGSHNCRSLRMKSPSSCEDIGRVERLSSSNFCLTSGRARTSRKSPLTFFTIEDGVPGGATRTNHPDAANPGTVSDTVGTSGRDAKRAGDATAKQLDLPSGKGAGETFDDHRYPTADYITHGLCTAGVEDVGQLRTGAFAEQFGG